MRSGGTRIRRGRSAARSPRTAPRSSRPGSPVASAALPSSAGYGSSRTRGCVGSRAGDDLSSGPRAVRFEPRAWSSRSGWANGWPGFRRSFGTIADFMVVTEPIPDRLGDIGWRTHVGIVDGRKLLYYLRRTEDDRVAIGEGTTGVVFGARASGNGATRDHRAAEVAASGLAWSSARLRGVRFTPAWGGPIDHNGVVHALFVGAPTRRVRGSGFSGHGLTRTKLGDGSSPPSRSAPWIGGARCRRLGRRWRRARRSHCAGRSCVPPSGPWSRGRESQRRRRAVVRSVVGGAPIAYRDRLVRTGAGVR